MEGYLQGSDDNEDSQFTNDCDNIFSELEGVVDAYYDKVSEAQSKQPQAEWED